MDSLFKKVGEGLESLGQQAGKHIEEALGGGNSKPAQSNTQQQDTDANPPETDTNNQHRFGSFAPQTSCNAKWYVDGASYFWAVSEAIESKLPKPAVATKNEN
jgi:phospholipase D1/2